ncbi:MAG TPA: DUF5915 domain-containing protein, partial [Ignavibacteriaceae bacterium]|nr:DUF5915 domain-containing protein [Ignavibacteriaceae bacterium]
SEIVKLESGQNVTINIGGEDISISKEDVEILGSEIKGWVVESAEGVTVAIDSELTPELIDEGLAREFVNRIQNMRKDAGFEVIDRIKIKYSGNAQLLEAVSAFKDYIANETLAEKLVNKNEFEGGYKQEWKIGDYDCSIQIEKVNP